MVPLAVIIKIVPVAGNIGRVMDVLDIVKLRNILLPFVEVVDPILAIPVEA